MNSPVKMRGLDRNLAITSAEAAVIQAARTLVHASLDEEASTSHELSLAVAALERLERGE